jgi:hypothetical protein
MQLRTRTRCVRLQCSVPVAGCGTNANAVRMTFDFQATRSLRYDKEASSIGDIEVQADMFGLPR